MPGTGYSSETYFIDVVTQDGGREVTENLIARLPPASGGLFPRYDLPGQARLQSMLHQRGFPVAPVVATDESGEVVGAPFFLMENVPGRLLPDDPGGIRSSWLAEAGEKAQRRLFCAFLDTLAALHDLDWRMRPDAHDGLCVDFLTGSEGTGQGGPNLESHLEWWDRYLRWAGPEAVPEDLGRSLDWCAANLPAVQAQPSLLWGDARLANVVFGESLRPVAVLDWEMASVGPAEVDIGWFLGLRGLALGDDAVELPGFPGWRETVEHYEAALGRELDDLRWHEVFALVRSTAVMARMGTLLGESGSGAGWRALMRPALDRIEALVEGAGGRG